MFHTHRVVCTPLRNFFDSKAGLKFLDQWRLLILDIFYDFLIYTRVEGLHKKKHTHISCVYVRVIHVLMLNPRPLPLLCNIWPRTCIPHNYKSRFHTCCNKLCVVETRIACKERASLKNDTCKYYNYIIHV